MFVGKEMDLLGSKIEDKDLTKNRPLFSILLDNPIVFFSPNQLHQQSWEKSLNNI